MDNNTLLNLYLTITISGLILLIIAIAVFIRNLKKSTSLEFGIPQPEDILSVDEKNIRSAHSPKTVTPLGICAFFPFFGIACICVHQVGLSVIPTIIIGIMIGISALVSASIIAYVTQLKCDASIIFVPNTAGAVGKVISDIPAAQHGKGIIRVYTNSQVAQFEAISLDEVTLTKGTPIKVLYADTDKVAVVERYINK